MSRSLRRVVAVSEHPELTDLLDALLLDSLDCDVIFLETVTRGYSCIKQVAPDLIVVFLAIGDAEACRLLSMLKMDSDMSEIPVVTCVTSRQECEFHETVAGVDRDPSSYAVPMEMN